MVYPFQGGYLAIVPPPRGTRSLLSAIVTATGLALAIALLWPGAARANTVPSPDPSTQILPDAAPVKGQPQSLSGSSSGPQAAGEVTPVAPTPVAPRHAPAGSASARTGSAHAAVRPAVGRDPVVRSSILCLLCFFAAILRPFTAEVAMPAPTIAELAKMFDHSLLQPFQAPQFQPLARQPLGLEAVDLHQIHDAGHETDADSYRC